MKAEMSNWHKWIDVTDPDVLDGVYRERLADAGFKILDECEHHFEPYGWTKLYLLAESHFAIHTFPEENRTYLELSSCVRPQYEKFLSMEGE